MEPSKDQRWKQRFENYTRAFKLLEQYRNQPNESELVRAGMIQFFEITFELSRKVLKDFLQMQGYDIRVRVSLSNRHTK